MAGIAAKPVAPFVGRETELRQLQQALRSVIDNKQPRFVLVQGDFGVGKTALVKRFLVEVVDCEPPSVLVGQGKCELATEGSGLLPFRQLLANLGEQSIRWGGVPGNLRDFVKEVAPAWLEVTEGAGAYSQENVFVQFTNALAKLAEKQPAVAFIDDLHWADASSMYLLFHLARCLQDRAVLVVCTYRPVEAMVTGTNVDVFREIRANLVACSNAAEIALGQGIDVTIYVNQRYQQHTFPSELTAHAQQQTGGHPLFVNQLFLWWEETGVIVPQSLPEEQTRWVLAQEAHVPRIPPNLGAMLDERLRQMTDELRQMLTDASVEGEDFTAQTITNLMRLDRLKAYRDLASLRDNYLMITSQGARRVGSTVFDLYRFAHPFFREHIYGKLAEGERCLLHQMVGEALETLFAERGPIAGQLARHFREAYQPFKAAHYARIAAEFEQSRYAWAEGEQWCELGLELLEKISPDEEMRYLQEAAAATQHQLAEARENLHLIQERKGEYVQSTEVPLQLVKDERRLQNEIVGLEQQLDGAASISKQSLQLDLLEQSGRGLLYSGNWARVDVRYRDALEIAQRLNVHAERIATLCLRLANICEEREEYDEGLIFAKQGQDILARHSVPLGKVHLDLKVVEALIYSRAGRNSETIQLEQEVLADVEKLPQTPSLEGTRITAYNVLAIAFAHLDRHSESIPAYQRAIEVTDRIGDKYMMAVCLTNMADDCILAGRLDEAEASASRALQIGRQIGDPSTEAYALAVRGRLLLWRGNPQRAFEDLQQAVVLSEKAGLKWITERGRTDLALAYLALSDLDTAYQEAKRVVEDLVGSSRRSAYAFSALAQVEAARQDWKSAAQHFNQAISFYQQRGGRYHGARVQRHFADALLHKGERPQAVELLQAALATFEDLRLDYEVAETQKLLDVANTPSSGL